jgi:hypothetical protein
VRPAAGADLPPPQVASAARAERSPRGAAMRMAQVRSLTRSADQRCNELTVLALTLTLLQLTPRTDASITDSAIWHCQLALPSDHVN